MRKLSVIVLVGMFLAITGSVQAATPLVDTAWMKSNAGKGNIVVIDFRSKSAYLKGHIPGAVHSSYGKDGWRVKNKTGTIGMLPPTAKLVKLIGGLGIGNNTHVVLAPPGRSSSDMGVGTRVYWTFKVLGHDNVSILNGGMAAYGKIDPKTKKPVNKMDKGAVKPKAKTFTTSVRKDMLVSASDIKAAIGKVPLVDNRTNDQFVGVNQHGKAKSPGTIPTATNLPQNWLTVNGGGMFRNKAQIEKLYQAAGVPTDGPQFSFCNTGHWASVGWFVSSEILGNKEARMYDGSMVEWTATKGASMEQKIKLN